MKVLFYLCCAVFSINATAQNLDDCFDAAGKAFNVNPLLLKAIAYTESRLNQQAININKDKNGNVVSTDFGVMQINDLTWFDFLRNYEITPEMIKTDPCVNIEAGAWVLASNFATSGEGWLAVGAYNAGYKKTATYEKIRSEYIALVKENLEILREW
jgi:soluble lytic murein transglycosylase-like protein